MLGVFHALVISNVASEIVLPGLVTKFANVTNRVGSPKPIFVAKSEAVLPQVAYFLTKEVANVRYFKDVFQRVCHGRRRAFVDSGANDGLWSLLAAAYGCDVVAIEPQPLCIRLLAAAAVKSQLSLTLHNVMLSARPNVYTMPVDTCAGTVQFQGAEIGDTFGNQHKRSYYHAKLALGPYCN